MRIVGGTWRGRPIKAPEGRDTRPTIDRVRESIASMVVSRLGQLEGASVLDAFAGSGAMGLELISRGAARGAFYDSDPKAIACVRDNVARLGATPAQARVIRGDVLRASERGRLAGTPFDVVFLDPPYATPAPDLSAMIDRLAARGQLVTGALVIYERDAKRPSLAVEGLALSGSKTYGTTAIDLFSFEGTPHVEL